LIFNVGESKKDGAEEIIKLLNERESYSGWLHVILQQLIQKSHKLY